MSSSHNTESSNGENVKGSEVSSSENSGNRVEVDNCAANTAEVQSTSNVEPFQHTEVAEESTSSCSSPTGIENNNATSQSTDCCVPIPESTACVHGNARRMIGLIQAKGYVHGILKPEEFNLRPSRHSIGRNGLGDVTLNLTEFLSYAQRNNYDIVIPASREVGNLNRPASAGLPRIGSGRGYMVLEQQHFPQDFNATTSYHPPEFIGLNNAPSRNSVLAPNMYHAEEIQPPAVDFSAPPPYEMPLKLPTYEEVQREKALEGEMLPPNMDTQNADPASPRTLSFLAIDTDMGPNPDPESKLLGTDFMFGVAFFLALVFNWVGFLLLMCFCHTVAARYGALSGFGLSLAKWTIIVKNSTESPPHNAWLWWLITAFGLLICIRSLFQYINIKRGWRLMSTATQERLLFFY